ncbi:MAG: VOC family protein [Nitrosomonadales bacterium]|nr:VOC family protein [Nitrosomonadales bacterium]
MQIQSLGHVVLKVRDLERSVTFYRDVLGMKEVMRYRGAMAFFSFGSNHHDLGLLQLGDRAALPDPYSLGLYHVAFKVGDTLDELRECKTHLEQHGVQLIGMSDHGVSQSLYLADPDGNEIELFVDADPASWRGRVDQVMTTKPLRL